MELTKIKVWIIHKLGGITQSEMLRQNQRFTLKNVPIHTLRCYLILSRDESIWLGDMRNRRLSEMIAAKLLEANMLEIQTEPIFDDQEKVTATLRVSPPWG